ncbi:unnamed protein product [Rotaria magnacalcarata]|uniref:PiggyBac transposable element-derived protein domain-containing protein n=1 Tax=Rotaria magnacalcarata TaxID=392030 RepID=A0A816R922_9BILA|nr:unnamed protein product [Rotaria magnacalcarata]
MSAIPKSNLKRIRDILLADENEISNDVNDNQGSDSDSDSDFLATESHDTFNSEHISEESDLSNSDFEHGDVVTVSQPETLKNNGVTWSIYPSLEQSRTAAANIRPRQDSTNVRSDSHFWKPVDRIELKSFIGLLIQSGVHRSNHE